MTVTVNGANQQGVHLYAAVGRTLIHYAVNVQACTLSRKGAATAPDSIQYAWPHPQGTFLYAATSDGGHSVPGKSHHLSVFRINPANGSPENHHSLIPLRSRPVHMTIEATGRYALIAYHFPARVSVHQILADGSIGDEVEPTGRLDVGIYPHQILVAPSNSVAVVVARGNDPRPGFPEDPGALKFLRLANGALTNAITVAPSGGYGFGPRHIAFDPGQRWIFAALERQNKLFVFKMDADEPYPDPLFVCETLLAPDRAIKNQLAGTLRIHPNGRFLYVINRASGRLCPDGERILEGGENNIAIFHIDQNTGKPTLVHNEDTRGINARTFSIDPSGRMLVAANSNSFMEKAGDARRRMPACLSTFRIGNDGNLTFVERYPVDAGNERLFWSGMIRVN